MVFTPNITTNHAITYTNTHVQIDRSIFAPYGRMPRIIFASKIIIMTMIVTMKTIKVNDNNGDNHKGNINNIIIIIIKIIKDSFEKSRMDLKHQA